jgi:divalent metal cation (Fe/Co/Zn/Cd) transporter
MKILDKEHQMSIPESPQRNCGATHTAPNPDPLRRRLIILQSVTLAWMLAECVLALWAAARAHSPALLGFGFDSLVELLSATLVVLTLAPRIDRKAIDRAAGLLLFALAAVVALTSVLALAGGLEPRPSPLGIFITAAALIVMPLLAWEKRKLARRTANLALAADAIQSAACAYLALVALGGLVMNAVFHLAWADAVAALAATPILIREGRRALRGQSCGCC